MSLDNILLLSDIDGTLLTYDSVIPKKNLEAIAYFKSLGGKFALATGRSVESARRAVSNLKLTNVPSVIYNGGAIYDYAAEKMLLTYSLPHNAQVHIVDVMDKFPGIGIEVYIECRVYCVNYSEVSERHMVRENTECVVTKLSDLPKGRWNKVLFTGYADMIEELMAYLSAVDLSDKDYYFMRSEKTLYELLPKKATKGNGLRTLARIADVTINKTYAIGDYFNDAELLKAAGYSAAVEESPGEIKAVADYVACPCEDGAVADFIEHIITITKKG